MSKYAWIITKDYFCDPREGDDSAVGVSGPRTATDEQIERAKKEGLDFRMFDDDNFLIYEGKYIGPDNESMFGPLDDYGTPNFGCTYIKYRNGHKWEVL